MENYRLKYYFKTTNAFTLIEIVIVVFIITILLGISISSYYFLNNIKDLETQGNQIADLIEFTKNRAINLDKSDITLIPTSTSQTIQSQKIIDYSLEIQNPNIIFIRVSYCSDFNCTSVDSTLIRRYILPNSNQLSYSKSSIVFKPRKNYIEEDFWIILKNLNIKKCRKISLTKSLVVEQQNVICL